jgi:hypothetical protein
VKEGEFVKNDVLMPFSTPGKPRFKKIPEVPWGIFMRLS